MLNGTIVDLVQLLANDFAQQIIKYLIPLRSLLRPSLFYLLCTSVCVLEKFNLIKMQMKFFEIKTILWPLLAKQSPIRCSADERAGEKRANNSINKQHIVTVAVAVATKADDCTTAQQLHEQ